MFYTTIIVNQGISWKRVFADVGEIILYILYRLHINRLMAKLVYFVKGSRDIVLTMTGKRSRCRYSYCKRSRLYGVVVIKFQPVVRNTQHSQLQRLALCISARKASDRVNNTEKQHKIWIKLHLNVSFLYDLIIE